MELTELTWGVRESCSPALWGTSGQLTLKSALHKGVSGFKRGSLVIFRMSASSLNTYLMLSSLLPPSFDTMHTYREKALQLKKLFSTYRWSRSNSVPPLWLHTGAKPFCPLKKLQKGKMPIWKVREVQKSSSLSSSQFTDMSGSWELRPGEILQQGMVWFSSEASLVVIAPLLTALPLCTFPSLSTLAHTRGGKRELNYV